ncbi:MAG: Mur ligase domain-containing protein, partial [Opitutales bacterium]
MKPSLKENYLFLGVGGMGMAPLACWMSSAGYSITGYDACLQEAVRRHLVDKGVALQDFVFPEHLGRFDTLVHSSALRPGHPILDAARAAGLKCMRRGEMLAAIAADRKLIAVVGSHGKTTTTGMIAYAIHRYGLSANYILGGLFSDDSLAPSHYSESPWLVAEVDESDGTIDQFCPEHSLVLNLDWDHADRYKEAAELEATFAALARRTRQSVFLPEGLALPGLDEAKARRYPSGVGVPFNEANARAALAVLLTLA